MVIFFYYYVIYFIVQEIADLMAAVALGPSKLNILATRNFSYWSALFAPLIGGLL
jgi:hypothetical protein